MCVKFPPGLAVSPLPPVYRAGEIAPRSGPAVQYAPREGQDKPALLDSDRLKTAMSESPLSRYERDLQNPGFQADDAQRHAVEQLHQLYRALIQPGPSGWRQWFRKPEPVKGLYMWGGVGRGKTYLMDTFFESLPFPQKMRTHFHRFMKRVHAELTRFKGEKNPLEKVAAVLAAEARVICFDEFFVVDITDAMILANLLKALFGPGYHPGGHFQCRAKCAL
jgi:Predicted ATPase